MVTPVSRFSLSCPVGPGDWVLGGGRRRKSVVVTHVIKYVYLTVQ